MTIEDAPKTPKRVSEVLQRLLRCVQQGEGPTVGQLRALFERRNSSVVMSAELRALPDNTIVSSQDLIDIFYASVKHAERIAEVEAQYHEGVPVARQGAKA